MATDLDAKKPSIKELVDGAEWAARVELAACYRLVAHYGMSDLIYNHITAHVPGHHDHVLINPYGTLHEEITASMLFTITLGGEVIVRPALDYGINETGLIIHGAIHEERSEVGCVIHTHARASMAVSAMKCGLLPLTQHAMRFYNKVSYHDYEGVAVNLEEKARLIEDLGKNDVMFLRNHGLVVCGTTVPEAFNTLYWVEMACKAQVDALRGEQELNMPPESVRVLTASQYVPEARRRYGELEWGSMLRLLERCGADYAR